MNVTGRPRGRPRVKVVGALADVRAGMTVLAAAKKHGISRNAINIALLKLRKGETTIFALATSEAARDTVNAHEGALRLVKGWQDAGAPSDEMPPDWDAFVNGGAPVLIETETSKAVLALVGLARHVNSFLGGTVTLAELAKSVNSESVMSVIQSDAKNTAKRAKARK